MGKIKGKAEKLEKLFVEEKQIEKLIVDEIKNHPYLMKLSGELWKVKKSIYKILE